MWTQPATARQIAALKSNGAFDGKYYSKGRAGQAIGESVRAGRAPAQIPSRPLGNWAQPVTEANLSDTPFDLTIDQSSVTDSQESTVMNHPVPIRNSIASSVEMAGNVSNTVTPFDYIGELEANHLSAVATLIGASSPRQVHALEKGWAIAKVAMAQKFARAHNEIVKILWNAPSGTIASPEATAQEILWNACSAELEKKLLDMTNKSRGTTRPSHVLDLLIAEVDHRVEMAKIYAQGKVDVARIQAARPPARQTGYQPALGEVTALKPFGAFVTLPSGETGLLHVSELQELNNGQWVEDPASLLNVGERVYVNVVGKNAEGKLSFALASEV